MKTRFSATLLNAGDRPKARYAYYVTGRGQFPFDMLRYDACWPADGAAAASMDDHHLKGTRSVLMHSFREPTVERWSSFMWSVGTEQLLPAPLPFITDILEPTLDVRWNSDWLKESGLEVIDCKEGYGVLLQNFENEFYVGMSTGQHGKTAWHIVHMSVDFGHDFRCGECDSHVSEIKKALNQAMTSLTSNWLDSYRPKVKVPAEAD